MEDSLVYRYQLDECLDWIIKNDYQRVILQFKPVDIGNSTGVLHYLKQTYSELGNIQKALDLYVTQSNTCCVDLIVTQHISNVDAIIHFGKACLSKPHLANHEEEIPIFFAFTHHHIQDEVAPDYILKKILDLIDELTSANSNCPVCLLYETNLVDYAQNILDILIARNLDKLVEVAKIALPSSKWSTVARQLSTANEPGGSLGHYRFSRPINSYKSAIFLGDKLPISWVLQMPSNVWMVNCLAEITIEKLNVSRILSKRMALVDRLRDDEELKFGVIITNPLPDFTQLSERLWNYAKPRKHTLYFITMIQTIDECKIGNFDLCDAFIVINNCSCSQILESLCFNRPILSEIEFRLACGFEAVYGQVLWPSSDPHQSEEDLITKRKVSDVSMALIHSRNELLERCSRARSNLWSGLEFKSADGLGQGEDLSIEEGLNGIASTYVSEPLRKSNDECN